MFICASYKFLKFRMLINSNAKFNVKCCFPTILAVFSTWSCRSTSLPFLLEKKKMFTIEEKIKLLDANKKTRQSCRQLADQFRIGKTAAAKIINDTHLDELVLYWIQYKNSLKHEIGCFWHFYMFTQSIKFFNSTIVQMFEKRDSLNRQ